MKRKFRLRQTKDFQRVREEGRSSANRFLVLSARPNDLPHSRFGFVVSRRIGIAVRRNRVKRLMREAARLHLSQIQPGWDIVFIARGSAAEADFWTLEKALMSLLRAEGLTADQAKGESLDEQAKQDTIA